LGALPDLTGQADLLGGLGVNLGADALSVGLDVNLLGGIGDGIDINGLLGNDDIQKMISSVQPTIDSKEAQKPNDQKES